MENCSYVLAYIIRNASDEKVGTIHMQLSKMVNFPFMEIFPIASFFFIYVVLIMTSLLEGLVRIFRYGCSDGKFDIP